MFLRRDFYARELSCANLEWSYHILLGFTEKKCETFFSQKLEDRQHVTEKKWLASHSATLPTHVTLVSHLTAAHQGRWVITISWCFSKDQIKQCVCKPWEVVDTSLQFQFTLIITTGVFRYPNIKDLPGPEFTLEYRYIDVYYTCVCVERERKKNVGMDIDIHPPTLFCGMNFLRKINMIENVRF